MIQYLLLFGLIILTITLYKINNNDDLIDYLKFKKK